MTSAVPPACTWAAPEGLLSGQFGQRICLPSALCVCLGRASSVSGGVTLPSELEKWHFRDNEGQRRRVGGPRGSG